MRIFFGVFLAFILMAPAAMADTIVGSATMVSGEVWLTKAIDSNGDTPEPIPEGQNIVQGDTIRTTENSKIEITFLDETTITLTGADGILTIDEYVYDPQAPETNTAKFSILKGPFHYVGGLLSAGGTPDVNIDIGTGSIGIRGTEFWRGIKDEASLIYLEKGEISVGNQHGEVILKPGQGTKVEPITFAFAKGATMVIGIADPRDYSQTEIKEIKGQLGI